eukprot:scaffold9288_cov23-Tisochrysis_lutea.AAC.2
MTTRRASTFWCSSWLPFVHFVEHRGEGGERLAHFGGGSRIDFVRGLVEPAVLVIDAEREELQFGRPDDERLNLRPREHRDGGGNALDGDSQVEPLHLLEHAKRDEPAECALILCERGRLLDLREDGLDSTREVERNVGPLHERVELAHHRRRRLEQPAAHHLVEQHGSRGGGREGEHLRHALGLLVLEVVLEEVEVDDGRRGWDGEGGEHGARGDHLHRFGRWRRLEVARGEEGARDGVRVEELDVGHPEDLGKVLMIGGDRRGLGRLLHELENCVDVLHSPVGLLPQLH